MAFFFNLLNSKKFRDRADAGQQLAKKLLSAHGDISASNTLVLALPRGGIQVGFEISKLLKLPLYPLVVRKIGAPDNPEFAIGAIAENDVKVIDPSYTEALGYSEKEVDQVIEQEAVELKRRLQYYRPQGTLPDLTNHTVILTDDGLATGLTMQAAIAAIKKLRPARIIVALPVAAADSLEEFQDLVDEVICLLTPKYLRAIGLYYQEFEQVTDDQVLRLLSQVQELTNRNNQDS